MKTILKILQPLFLAVTFILVCLALKDVRSLKTYQLQTGAMGAFGPTATLTVANWYVDPANNSTCASDSNTGQSATCTGGTNIGPFLTVAQVYNRWGNLNPPVRQATTVHLLSDDVSSDPWLAVSQTIGDEASFLTVIGTPTVMASGTIGTWTPLNRNTPTLNKITSSGHSTNYWSTACSGTCVGLLVHDTTVDAYAWIYQDLGTATASLSASMAPVSSVPPYRAMVNGDAYQVLRPPNLYIATADSTGVPQTQFILVTNTAPMMIANSAAFDRSRMSSGPGFVFSNKMGEPMFLGNCELDSASEIAGISLQYGGLYLGTELLQGTSAFGSLLDGDVLMTGTIYVADWLTLGEAAFFDATYAAVTNQPNFVNVVEENYGLPKQWGTAPFNVADGTQIRIGTDTTATAALLLTGGYEMDGRTTACTYDLSGDPTIMHCGITLSPANIDKAVSLGGFGGVAFDQYGSRVFIRQ